VGVLVYLLGRERRSAGINFSSEWRATVDRVAPWTGVCAAQNLSMSPASSSLPTAYCVPSSNLVNGSFGGGRLAVASVFSVAGIGGVVVLCDRVKKTGAHPSDFAPAAEISWANPLG
jgi:hypothetical protein